MPRQGLNRDAVIQAALRLIEKQGMASFSMAELAKSLDVKTASLYNHIESMDALFAEVGRCVINKMLEIEAQAIEGRYGDDALFSLALSYRAFAREHYEWYRILMSLVKTPNKLLEREAERIVDPILKTLAEYGLDSTERIHWQRVLRSVMHGFVMHEQAGGFSHFPADREESYRIAIRCVADGLRAAGKEGQNGQHGII